MKQKIKIAVMALVVSVGTIADADFTCANTKENLSFIITDELQNYSYKEEYAVGVLKIKGKVDVFEGTAQLLSGRGGDTYIYKLASKETEEQVLKFYKNPIIVPNSKPHYDCGRASCDLGSLFPGEKEKLLPPKVIELPKPLVVNSIITLSGVSYALQCY